ncbi:MAG: hypothetical protein AAGG08_13665 [Actinomycetota bacterium]
MARPPALDDSSHEDSVELILPARTQHAATIRVLIASLGADVGLTLDEIDDLRLAVTEVFMSAASADGADRFSASLLAAPGRLEVRMFAIGPHPLALDALAETILEAVVDVEVAAGTITLAKTATELGEATNA